MDVIGITGGIGSGKSTVSNYLRSLGYEIIDADGISRQVTGAGSPILKELGAAFGSGIFTSGGDLNRRKLAEIVFHDPSKNRLLQSIVTVKVKEIAGDRIRAFREAGEASVLFLDVPLLYETGSEVMCDQVWYVTAEREIRIRRVIKRDGADREQVIARMESQMPEAEKRRRADRVIDNSGDLPGLQRQIDALLEEHQGKGLTNR